MSPTKFVLKCGSFAVLVDLYVLPQGLRDAASWFGEQYKEEVCEMIRDAVDQRVRQFLETRHQRGHPKQKKGLTPCSPICIKGEHFRLAAYFMKRYINLRCVGRRHQGDLRVFPERLVVCASVPEEAVERGGTASCAAMEHGGSSKSEYFSGRHETQDPLNSSAITKRNTLQKIAKKASVQAHPSHWVPGGRDHKGAPPLSVAMETEAGCSAMSEVHGGRVEVDEKVSEDRGNGTQTTAEAQLLQGAGVRDGLQHERPGPAPRQGCTSPSGILAEPPRAEPAEGEREGAGLEEGGEGARRACAGRVPASRSEAVTETRSAECPAQSSTPQPSPGKGLTQPNPGPKPLLPRNSLLAGWGGLAGCDGDASSQHREVKHTDAEQGVENQPRKSRLKRVKKNLK